jgi:hypothetical protein
LTYSEPTAADPTTEVFRTQAQVDAFLADNSALAFKHIQPIIDALPREIAHTVTLELAAGTHRPLPAAGSSDWLCYVDKYMSTGGIVLQGAAPNDYAELVSAKAPTGYSNAGFDPYIDFAAGSYPNDGSLKGRYAVISTGQTLVIHDHTDSRLYLCGGLTSDPTGGSVVVAEPSTVLSNSADDVTAQTYGIYFTGGSAKIEYSGINDIAIRYIDGGPPCQVFSHKFVYERVLVDQSSSGSGGIRLTDSFGRFYYCSRVAPPNVGSDPFYASDADFVSMRYCYWTGGLAGGVDNSPFFYITDTVLTLADALTTTLPYTSMAQLPISPRTTSTTQRRTKFETPPDQD